MDQLEIIPLGGMSKVTQNMFLYKFGQEILIFDCGIGFPDIQMPGADILIPDTRYLHQLLDEGNEIVGMVLTHGHDDHIAATPYILPELPEFPIYASPLTGGFAENRMKEGKVQRPVEAIQNSQWYKIGSNFEILSVPVTHSVPDTRHYFIRTPQGTIYHGTDFKLDKNPVDGVMTDEEEIQKISQQEKILCMLVDCLRVERSEWVPSESTTGPAIEEEIVNTQGKVIVTLMSSHIHRIQQTVDAAIKHGRKVAFIGRSVEQNVEVALRLNKLKIPRDKIIDKRDIDKEPEKKMCLIVAGSQGQEGSSLVRAVFGEHQQIHISNNDKVIFSADAIPGNEVPYFHAIDELSRNGVDVVYPDVNHNLHQSGHASAPEQQHLVQLVDPKYVMPIGGADRHRTKFIEFVAQPLGIDPKKVILPPDGETVIFDKDGRPMHGEKFQIVPRIVDGLGIGDVGPRVLSDRKMLGEAGIIVLLIPRRKNRIDFNNINMVSRGFVFMKQANEVINFIKEQTVKILRKAPKKASDDELKKKLERQLSKKLFKIIRREPLIVAEFIDQ